MSLNAKAIGNRIVNYRKKRGYTQQDLADAININASFLSHIETGTRCSSLETLIEIANALNVTADDLLQDCLENTVRVHNHDFSLLLADCTSSERELMREIIVAVKMALRRNDLGSRR